eukprot:gene11639-15589_t
MEKAQINAVDDNLPTVKESSTQEKSKSDQWCIETFLRIRPSLRNNESTFTYKIDDITIADGNKRSIIDIEIPPDADPGIVHNNSLSGKLRFEFDKIFDDNTTQEEIFDQIAKDKVLGAMDGINCTIFAYGQTGSGKTYTIFGGETYQERGIIPRTLGLVFDEIKFRKKQKSFNFKCQVSFTEIYKETVYDLLDKSKRNQPIESWPSVQLLEGENGIVLRNLNVYEVASEEDALQLFFMGNTNRITSSTSMNNVSSRSHAVFTIVLESEGIKDNKTLFCAGKINLVDLAGSERMYKMANSKGAINEAKSINLSLHFLEQVIVSLREQNNHQNKMLAHTQSNHNTNQSLTTPQGQPNLQEIDQPINTNNQASNVIATPSNGFIPYRNSILTNMLRDSLGGNCKSAFLLAMTKERIHFEETIATCRFGQRCGEVKVQIFANAEIGLSDQLKELMLKVKSLERQLQHSEEQRKSLERIVEDERELRRKQTQLRAISMDEKAKCKNSVQVLLAAAKEALTLTSGNGTGSARSSGQFTINSEGKYESKRETAESIIEKSQETLYYTMEAMDKAVLVELSTALGGLVQSMYIERETNKKEETLKQQKLKQAEEELDAKIKNDAINEQILKNGKAEELLTLSNLPENKMKMLFDGAVFIKHGWLGKKKVKFYSVSNDLLYLMWKPMINSNQSIISSCPLAHFDSVELAYKNGSNGHKAALCSPADNTISNTKHQERDCCVLILRGNAGQKSLHLEYADKTTIEENIIGAEEWLSCLRYLIHKSKGRNGLFGSPGYVDLLEHK